jgi:hypothetical protein
MNVINKLTKPPEFYDKKPAKLMTEEEIKVKLAEMQAKLKPIIKDEKMIKSEKNRGFLRSRK